ncbi:ATP synthase subunit gamma, mitochondrial-like isoform X3 [Leptidea sinapis]|uniref:ATP synthase subunit gamma, mitochondrial-like isoform X2 n=1 Tax=Leptidea sinapis TaxID=189913 RepID=UPI002145A414|nr:ATP synthase subunit gamma, mitochondrial-like isoform X2 [Leptidea sinapis]XP_050683007.1 ATP synthase subunit gamma, mitochondrial-like isoform X3 [Leptidea sinapis]
MVQLKQVSLRLKSIKNIQKITKTMKMVSASKFTKAERELSAARPFGYGPRKFYESSQLVKGPVDQKEKEKQPDIVADKTEDIKDDKMTKRIYVAVTSDRGLCGGVHSGVSRRIRREMSERKGEGPTNRIVCIGDKSRAMLRREFSDRMLINVKDIGRIAPVFADASAMAAAIAESGYQYDVGEIFYNKYFTPVKYELTVIPFFNKYKIETAPNMNAFDDVDQDQLECYSEWTLAALLYYVLKEGAASEQSARMSAMDNATKNADEMIKKLTLLFNRTRQAVITRELIEIISGAAALE